MDAVPQEDFASSGFSAIWLAVIPGSIRPGEQLVRKPAQPARSLLLAQGSGQSRSSDAGSAPPRSGSGKITVIQPSWVLVSRGGGLEMLYEHDVIVKDDLIESVRPRQRT